MGIFAQDGEACVKVIASKKNWIESSAIEQLQNTAELPGIRMAVGLPDLHPGKDCPIGAAFISAKWIYPQLIGNDIGCGMGLWQTDLKVQNLSLDNWIKKLGALDAPWSEDVTTWLNHYNLESSVFDRSLGTIGGGNHFAELQAIESIEDYAAFTALGLDKKNFYLLVHSGSRGLGAHVFANYLEAYNHRGLHQDTTEAIAYLATHDKAAAWAKANRALIAHRFLVCLHSQSKLILDINHNTVTMQEIDGKRYWLHRKGVIPATAGVVIIPGSRGSLSYLVQPIGLQTTNAYSLAHGAGRKWKRTDAKSKLAKYSITDFAKTALGGRVICTDKNLMYEEAPQAYKNIEIVIKDMVDAGLISVIATLRPVITYKTRRH
ncbi:release factor H-coupled RctB family protein [Gammaproteobacteria bacterium]